VVSKSGSVRERERKEKQRAGQNFGFGPILRFAGYWDTRVWGPQKERRKRKKGKKTGDRPRAGLDAEALPYDEKTQETVIGKGTAVRELNSAGEAADAADRRGRTSCYRLAMAVDRHLQGRGAFLFFRANHFLWQ